jgi:oxygen-independent coproporphyrinogen-3 oxidase
MCRRAGLISIADCQKRIDARGATDTGLLQRKVCAEGIRQGAANSFAPDPFAMVASDISRLTAKPVPRYTSYPTAPHFHPGIREADYGGWLKSLPESADLSLYMHIPFCDSLCWFCGCHTRITRRYEPVGLYLGGLIREIRMVAGKVPPRATVSHIHWGGGSPTMLSADDIVLLGQATREAFSLRSDCEFAVEIDPRGLDQARIDALATIGLTRVSLGVQDFDPEVQWAINREQSFEETRRVAEAFRAHGVTSLNIDAIYGLPHQTEARLLATLDKVVSLNPDRIALFGYAHVPWMKKHQEMIPPEALPGIEERFIQAESAARFLTGNGYVRVGIDHFAKPGDALAIAARLGRLRRNFQGYTVDPADALIGFGASAISSLPQGYVQNEPTTGRYLALVAEGKLPTARGVALTAEDRLRRSVIEALMCGMALDERVLARSDAPEAIKAEIRAEMEDFHEEERHGWVKRTRGGLIVSEAGRPFLRLIAARFDAYLARAAGRHSVAV